MSVGKCVTVQKYPNIRVNVTVLQLVVTLETALNLRFLACFSHRPTTPVEAPCHRSAVTL